MQQEQEGRQLLEQLFMQQEYAGQSATETALHATGTCRATSYSTVSTIEREQAGNNSE
jgi:hypothetical protein